MSGTRNKRGKKEAHDQIELDPFVIPDDDYVCRIGLLSDDNHHVRRRISQKPPALPAQMTMSDEPSFDEMPDEVLLNITGFLSNQDLLQLRGTSLRMKRISDDTPLQLSEPNLREKITYDMIFNAKKRLSNRFFDTARDLDTARRRTETMNHLRDVFTFTRTEEDDGEVFNWDRRRSIPLFVLLALTSAGMCASTILMIVGATCSPSCSLVVGGAIGAASSCTCNTCLCVTDRIYNRVHTRSNNIFQAAEEQHHQQRNEEPAIRCRDLIVRNIRQ